MSPGHPPLFSASSQAPTPDRGWILCQGGPAGETLGEGAEGWELMAVWEGMDRVGEDAKLHREERGCLKGVKRQNSSSPGRRRLLIIGCICARSSAHNSTSSSFTYKLEFKCVFKTKPRGLITVASSSMSGCVSKSL